MRKLISAVVLCSVLLSALSICTFGFEYTDIACNEEWTLHKMINEHRNDEVSLCAALQDAAGIRAKELLSDLSHYRGENKAWYSVLDEKGIVYTPASFEVIAANFDSEKDVLDAVLSSSEGKKLLSDIDHLGIGYASSASTKNRTAWCIIGLECNDASSTVLHYSDIHFTYGQKIDDLPLVIEEKCIHGSSYLKALPRMITGYDENKIGTQILAVNYKNTNSEFVITNDYKDVSPKAWYYKAIMNCTEAGYYSGVGEGKFAPSQQMTREMFVTVLGRFAGIDAKKYTGTSFSDVKSTRWSAPYIEWAAKNKIVSGYSDKTFCPTKGITRQEMCSIVKRYVDAYGIDIPQINAEKTFTDSLKIGKWAASAVSFCQTRGIVSGEANGAFNPQNNATRAEVAVIITNMEKAVK